MKRLVVSAAVLCLGIAGVGSATAAPAAEKVTGGGQIIMDTEMSPATGPGSTIAFNAQAADQDPDTDVARGQVQFVGRDGAGEPTDKFHGVVDCLVVEGNMARFAGDIRDNDGDDSNDERFRVDVLDNDAMGGMADMDDMVMVVRDADANCDDDTNAMEQLGRGNVTIHEARAAE